MNSMYRRGWFNDSHRHYLAAKGIKTRQRYFAENTLMPPEQIQVDKAPQSILVNPRFSFRGPAAKGQPEREIGGRVRSEKAVKAKLGETARLATESEMEVKKQGESGYAKVIATKDPTLMRQELIAQNQLLGKGDDAKTLNRTAALQAKLGELEFERARLGLPINTSGLTPAAKKDLEQFAKAKGLQEATQAPTSVFGQFLEGLGEKASTEFGRTGAEAQLIQAKRLERADTVDEFMRERAAIDASGLTGWDSNPVVQDTRQEPFFGAFNPFEVNPRPNQPRTYIDTDTPIKDRDPFKIKSDITGVGNPALPGWNMGADVTQTAVDEVYKAKHELAKADKSAFEKGKAAFKKGNREDLVKAIVDLDSQAYKLDEMQQLVQTVDSNVTSPEYIGALMSREQSMFDSPFGGSKARTLAEDAGKIAETKAEIRKAANEVKGRRDDLKNKLSRVDAALPPQTTQSAGIVEVFQEDKKSVMESPVSFSESFIQESARSSPLMFAKKRYI